LKQALLAKAKGRGQQGPTVVGSTILLYRGTVFIILPLP